MSMFKAPKVPDAQQAIAQGTQVANQQNAMNMAAADRSQAASMVGQENPYGSLSYKQTGTGPGGVPLYTAVTNLSPEQQKLFDTYQATQQQAGNLGQSLLGFGQYNKDPVTAIGDMESGLTGRILDKYRGYISPFQETERANKDAALRNQGLMPGTPAYDNAMRSLETNQNLANAKYIADAQGQAFGQAKDLWSAPAAMAAQLAQWGAPGSVKDQIIQTPQYNVNPANLIGSVANAQEAQNQQYQAKLAQQQAAMTGLFNTIGTIGGFAMGGPLGAGLGNMMGWNTKKA